MALLPHTSSRMLIAVIAAFIVFPLACSLYAVRDRIPPAAIESQAITGAMDVINCLATGVPLHDAVTFGLQTTTHTSLLGTLLGLLLQQVGCAPLTALRLAAWLMMIGAVMGVCWFVMANLRCRMRAAAPAPQTTWIVVCAGLAAGITLALAPWTLVHGMTYGTVPAVTLMTVVSLLVWRHALDTPAWHAHTLLGLVLALGVLAQSEWALTWIPAVLVASAIATARHRSVRAAGMLLLTWLGVLLLAAWWRQSVWLGAGNVSTVAVAANVILIVGIVAWALWLRRAVAHVIVQQALCSAVPLAVLLAWWLGCGDNAAIVRTALRNNFAQAFGAQQQYITAVMCGQYAGSWPALVCMLLLAGGGIVAWVRAQPELLWLLCAVVLQLWRSPMPVTSVLATLLILLALAVGCGMAGVTGLGQRVSAAVASADTRVRRLIALLAQPLTIVALYGCILLPGMLPRMQVERELPSGGTLPGIDATRTWWQMLETINDAVPPHGRVAYTPDQYNFSRLTLVAYARMHDRAWDVVPWPVITQVPVPDVADYYVIAGPITPDAPVPNSQFLHAHFNQQKALFDADPAWRLCGDATPSNGAWRVCIYGRAAANPP